MKEPTFSTHATPEEIEKHHALLDDLNKNNMKKEENRKIITFQIDRNWRAIWPKKAKLNPMAYKGLGYVEPKSGVK